MIEIKMILVCDRCGEKKEIVAKGQDLNSFSVSDSIKEHHYDLIYLVEPALRKMLSGEHSKYFLLCSSCSTQYWGLIEGFGEKRIKETANFLMESVK